MILLNCSHCTASITSKMEKCPKCGAPIDTSALNLPEASFKHLLYHLVVLFCFNVLFFLFSTGPQIFVPQTKSGNVWRDIGISLSNEINSIGHTIGSFFLFLNWMALNGLVIAITHVILQSFCRPKK